MKQHFPILTRHPLMRVVLAGCLALLAACSEGSGTTGEEPTPNIAKPAITKFEIRSVDDATNVSDWPESAIGSILVNSGEGIVITWETSNAETVTLTSNGTVKSDGVEASGSTTVDRVTQSDTFTLTASTGGVEAQATIKMTVAAAKPVANIVGFESTGGATLTVGQSTQLCYDVSPDTMVEVRDVATNTVVGLADDATSDDDSEDAAESDVEDDVDADDVSDTDTETTADDVVPEEDALSTMTKLSLMAATVGPGTPEDDGLIISSSPTDTDDDQDSEEETDVVGSTVHGCTVPLSLGAGEHAFRLTVTDSEGNQKTQEVKITVEAGVSIKEFTVNGGPSTTVQVGEPLAFAFTVEPATAEVTLEPGFGVRTLDANGQGKVATKAEQLGIFTYTLTAKDLTSDATDEATVTVTVIQPPVVAAPKLTASTSGVFAGEKVTFKVTDVVQGLTVALRQPNGKTTPIDGTVTIPVTAAGAYQAVGTTSAETVVYSEAVNLDVRNWGAAKGGSNSWGAVSLGSDGSVMTGGDKAPRLGSSAMGNDWVESTVGIAKAFEALSGVPAGRQEQFGATPVYGVAMDSAKAEGKRVYAGVGGGVLFSNDGGKSWTALDHMLIWKGSPAPAKVCRGATRTVGDGSQTDLIAVHHVCDVVVDAASGRLFAAVDDGVIYLDNPDAAIADVTGAGKLSAENGWKGFSSTGTLAAGSLSNTLVHDLDFSGGTLYAATPQGVYSNTQNGADGSWAALSGGIVDGKEVYAIAVDAANNVAYAGTADGNIAVRSLTGDGAAWASKKSVESAVYSIDVDDKTGDVIAGTGAGVYISRDKGENWADISATLDTAAVYGVAIQSGADGQIFAAATDKGVYVSRPAKKVDVAASEDEEPADEVVPEETPGEETTPDTVAPGGEEPPADDTVAPNPPPTGASNANASLL